MTNRTVAAKSGNKTTACRRGGGRLRFIAQETCHDALCTNGFACWLFLAPVVMLADSKNPADYPLRIHVFKAAVRRLFYHGEPLPG